MKHLLRLTLLLACLMSAQISGVRRQQVTGFDCSGIPLAGPFICYDFVQGPSATTLYDRSGNGNDATFVDGRYPTWTSTGLDFAATNGTSGQGAGTNFIAVSKPGTVFVVYKSNTVIDGDAEQLFGPGGIWYSKFVLELKPNGTIRLQSSRMVDISGSTSTAFLSGNWTCATASYSATGEWAYYINGAPTGTGTNDAAMDAATNLSIGSNDGQAFVGSMAYQIFHQSVVSPTNVAAVYSWLKTGLVSRGISLP